MGGALSFFRSQADEAASTAAAAAAMGGGHAQTVNFLTCVRHADIRHWWGLTLFSLVVLLAFSILELFSSIAGLVIGAVFIAWSVYATIPLFYVTLGTWRFGLWNTLLCFVVWFVTRIILVILSAILFSIVSVIIDSVLAGFCFFACGFTWKLVRAVRTHVYAESTAPAGGK